MTFFIATLKSYFIPNSSVPGGIVRVAVFPTFVIKVLSAVCGVELFDVTDQEYVYGVQPEGGVVLVAVIMTFLQLSMAFGSN